MRKNTMLRLAALTAAITMTFSAVSCSSNDSNNKDSSKSKTSQSDSVAAKELLNNSYKAVPLDFDEAIGDVSNLMRFPDSDKIAFCSYVQETREPCLYFSDIELSETKKIELDLNKGKNTEVYFNAAMTNDGIVYLLANISDYGDFELPDYADPDFDYSNFDYEAMEEAKTVTYKLFCIDSDGNVVSESEITDYDEYVEEDANELYVNSIAAIGKDKIAIVLNGTEESVIVLDTDGKIQDKINTDDLSWIMGLGSTSDGKFALCGDTPKGVSIVLYDAETLKPTGSAIELDQSYLTGMASIQSGTGDYMLYLNTGSVLAGIKADNTVETILNFTDADLSQMGSNYIIPANDGEYLVYSNDYQSDSGFYRLVKRDASELENTKIITLGTLYDDYSVSQRIKEFNKSHDDVRIKNVNYAKYNEYDEETGEALNSSTQQLKMDIVAGKAPDMIVTYNDSIITSLANKDIYCDLYEFMNKDDELTKDKFIPSILTLGEYNGKLLSISPTFEVSTYAIKSKYFDKENWTFEDMKEVYEKNKDKMSLTRMDSKQTIFSLLLYSSNEYIDYEKATCNFDTDNFTELLEFCNQFPDSDDLFNWDSSSEGEMQKFLNDSETAVKDDKALIYDTYFTDFRVYAQTKQGAFGGEDITLVGYPSSNGKGAKVLSEQSFAILQSSSNQQECWSFIKDFFLNTTYDSQSVWGLPSLKEAFDKKAEESMKKPYYIDENGKKQEYDDVWYSGDQSININPLTKEEKDFMLDYISNVDASLNIISDDVDKIITDETDAYFKGEKSAKEVASTIQSKISILLSEQS